MKKVIVLFLWALFLLVSCNKEDNKIIPQTIETEKSFDSPAIIDVDLNTSLSEPALWND